VQAAVVGGDGLLHVLGQVVPQMPAVGDLDRRRCPMPSSIGVGAGPVPADHLGARVLAQPPGEGVGFPVAQQIDRSVGGDVDQHRAIDAAAAQREVVHAEHGHASGLGIWQRPDQTQQRAAADRQPQRAGQPRPSATCQRQADRLQHPARQRAAAGVRRGQARDLLGECAG
jgi:hypothetical protein